MEKLFPDQSTTFIVTRQYRIFFLVFCLMKLDHCYTVSTVDERNIYGICKMTETWENCKYSEKNLSQCHFVHHKHTWKYSLTTLML
jgi:hypothetical protein